MPSRRHSIRWSRLWTSGLVIAGFAGAALAESPGESAWRQWGGTNQDFKASAAGLADNWPESGPPKVWERELGDGYSAILFEDGVLYTMYRASEDKEAVIALKADTGETVWEYRYESAVKEGHVKDFGSGPRSTPLIVEDRLYTIGIAGKMHCLDKFTGKPHWHKNLWDDLGGNFLMHGYASSPIAYKNTVIALVGAKDQSIVAFDQKDGSVKWKSASFENGYSTPRLFRIDGEDHLVTFMATEIVGLEPATGEIKWSFPQENQWKQNICMPTLASGNILFFSSPDAGAHGLKIERTGSQYSVSEVWSTRKIQFYHVTSVANGDFVYGCTGTQGTFFIAAVNMKTGDIAWRKRGFSKANVIQADGKLIILDEDGNLALAAATPEDFTVLAKFQLFDDVSWTVPTVAGKYLFARDKKSIKALNLG
ncbi:MAG: PQQ-binding-like beta-propeller repeat protein [Phycisphaerae bacterium]|nr:PQQ-binding-like beta-propeller repeat protein [Phycisphaerae bacterium]